MIRIKERPVIFKNLKRKQLWGVLSLPKKKRKAPAIIIAHGLYGSKSNPKFVKIGRKFAQNGIAVLRFDFSGCGDSEGDFKKISLWQEVEDLKAAYKFLVKQLKIDKKRIGFLGYSLGALISCLLQLKYPVAKSLVLVAPALDQENLIKIWYSPNEIRKWRKRGYINTPKFRIGIQYLNEAKNYTRVVSNIKISTLIIHGEKDEDVPLRFSRDLLKSFGDRAKMIVVKEADHNFEGYQVSNALVNYSLRWFKRTL